MILSFIIRNTATGTYLMELGDSGTMTTQNLSLAKLFYTSTIADVVVNRLGKEWTREEYWLMTMPDAKRTKDWKEELKKQDKMDIDKDPSKWGKHPELYGNYGC
jgi:hypothetical protein